MRYDTEFRFDAVTQEMQVRQRCVEQPVFITVHHICGVGQTIRSHNELVWTEWRRVTQQEFNDLAQQRIDTAVNLPHNASS